MDRKEEIDHILSCINQGIATAEQLEAFQHWYYSVDKEPIDWASLEGEPDLQAIIWQRIQQRQVPKKTRFRPLYPMAAAVAALALLFGGWWAWSSGQDTLGPTTPFQSGVLLSAAGAPDIVIQQSVDDFLHVDDYINISDASNTKGGKPLKIKTAKGQFTKVVLPDGSKVSLNAATTIHLDPDFLSAAQRRITLDGEAFFEVSQDPERPFIVQAKDQQIHVLGTQFNVKAYANQEQTITTLLKGKIELSHGQRRIMMSPLDVVRTAVGKVQHETISPNKQIGWRTLQFEFYEEPLQEVLAQLERWYGVTISYASVLPQQYITGKIHPQATLPEVLQILSLLSNADFHLQGQVVHVHPKH